MTLSAFTIPMLLIWLGIHIFLNVLTLGYNGLTCFLTDCDQGWVAGTLLSGIDEHAANQTSQENLRRTFVDFIPGASQLTGLWNSIADTIPFLNKLFVLNYPLLGGEDGQGGGITGLFGTIFKWIGRALSLLFGLALVLRLAGRG